MLLSFCRLRFRSFNKKNLVSTKLEPENWNTFPAVVVEIIFTHEKVCITTFFLNIHSNFYRSSETILIPLIAKGYDSP